MGQADEVQAEGLYHPLVKTGAILGVVQGLVWTILGLTAILLSGTSIEFTTISLGTFIYSLYLNSSSQAGDGIIIATDSFIYFLYIYVALSGTWLIVSSVLLWEHVRGKTSSKYREGALATWTVVVSLTSILDLILFSLLLHDYQNVQQTNNSQDLEVKMSVELTLVAIGVVFTISARGFVLWIVNVIFAIIAGKLWYLKRNKVVAGNQPFINAYSNGQVVPWQQNPNLYEESNSLGLDNKGFRNDNEALPFPSQNALQKDKNRHGRPYPQNEGLRPQYGNNDNNFWNNRNNQINREGNALARSYNNAPEPPSAYRQDAPARTAKIGRQGGQRSPPLNVAPPYIPDPDYSPPGSPKVRGVLRPKSNYERY